MSDIWNELLAYLQYPFVQRAMIVGLAVALCASLLGVPLVLKRFSFIGDGLSHVAFGAMAVASVMNLTDNMMLILPVTVFAAVLLLKTSQNTRIKGDAAIAIISVSTLAVGYLLMSVFSTSANFAGDVCSTLFGAASMLTLTNSDVWVSVIMTIFVLGVFLVFYHKIFAVTFDENFSAAIGMQTGVYHLILAIVTALVIVAAMKLVGSLLISALIIFPALSSMRVFKSFQSVMICSAVISLICTSSGMLLSIVYSTPVGSTIVGADMLVFFIFCLVSWFRPKRHTT